MSAVEMCAGGGGQALGLEQAGFGHEALIEIDGASCSTLRTNRPHWKVLQQDLRDFDGCQFRGVDLLAGGLPCPPFSVAGKQLGEGDERNLFPEALRLVDEIRPAAIMIENVRGILDPVFAAFRGAITGALERLGYATVWRLLNCSSFGLAQLRPRAVLVGIKGDLADGFAWPAPRILQPGATVGDVLYDLMAERGWRGAAAWREGANQVAPTIVGGSHKHGGPDLGPTRARRAWAALGVDGIGIADEAPHAEFTRMPKLTIRMVARLQGFPDEWQFCGGKTAAYRQVGNAFPPPAARAIAEAIGAALGAGDIGKLRAAL